MKRFLIPFCVFFFGLLPQVFAYSSGFEYMMTVMNIERVNVNGLTLNEDVYDEYQLLVYGNPSTIKHKEQRWKECSNGKWTLNGVRGEYWILGEDYSGKAVHNEFFPDDYVSGTSPLDWNYRVIKDAEESWNDTSKFQYEIQREYMMNSKLTRFGITYDINALTIGLDKARVENYASWGNAGSIYTEKPGIGNTYWVATFRVPPMAENAKLNSILQFPNGTHYTIKSEEENLVIPVNFGAYVDNLSEYAKPEHVRVIEANLTVNGISEDMVSGSKVYRITKDGAIVIQKSDFPNQNKITLQVECNSILSTAFVSDSFLYASKKEMITIQIENEEVNIIRDQNKGHPPIIHSCILKRISTNARGKEEAVSLYQSKKTHTSFICAGQVLQIEVRTSTDTDYVTFDFQGKNSITILDNVTKKFEWDDPKARGIKTRYDSWYDFMNSYALPRKLTLKSSDETGRTYVGIYVIPYGTTQTLHSWNSLREISKNAFQIDESKLFARKDNSYEVVVKAYGEEGVRTERYPLDVAERWDELYNRDLSQYVIINGR